MDSPSHRKSWTVIVFMAVDDSLAPYALADIRQMQTVGSSPEVDIVVQLNWKNARSERYHVLSTDIQPLTVPELSDHAASSDALSTLLLQAQTSFPADHYMLHLWGHAYGVGFGRSTDDRLPLGELARVLTDFAECRQGLKLEVLAGVACRMGKIETVYELRDGVRFLVTSQVGIPFCEWPYKAFLSDLTATPSMTPAHAASIIVQHYCDSYRRRTAAMTALDLDATASVFTSLLSLATVVSQEVQTSFEDPQTLHDVFRQSVYDDVEPLVDLQDLCERLSAMTASAHVRRAADHVVQMLRESCLVALHDAVGPRAHQLHGLSVSVPQVALNTSAPTFSSLGFDQSRLWRDVLDSVTKESR
jgi:hypothetical protein